MPAVTRSKRKAVDDVDQLSGLFTSMNITPKTTRKHKTPRVKKEKDISDLFSGLGLSSKSRRRHKGSRFTHKKTHKSTARHPEMVEDMDMQSGGAKRRRRHRRRATRRH